MDTKKTLIALGLGTVSLLAWAAASFLPSEQPFGYIAPVALSTPDINASPVAFAPRFEYGTYVGDLVAANVLSNGNIDLENPLWRAAEQLDQQDWDEERFIVTVDLEGSIVPFRKDDMSKDQVNLFKKDEKKRIPYLRGNRDKEGDKFRSRGSVLGDIIHSNPVYVGAPEGRMSSDGYAAFAQSNATRAARVYVGANDGMLHAFDASNGKETFAYIPSMVLPKLKAYSDEGYTHDYFVDGPLTAGDAYYSGAWSTLLVGGLGAGGRGLFALDITSAQTISNEGTSASGAGSKVLWERSAQSSGMGRLGFTYARASIVKLNNGQWAVAVGNGYLSNGGYASLFLLNPATGAVLREIVTADSNDNGLSTPTLIDVDRDGAVDYAYAGDLNGNVWRFDLTSASAAAWHVAYSNKPLLTATDSAGVAQAITTALDVSGHPNGGYFVYAATGRLLANSEGSDVSEQAVYGIWDNDWESADLPVVHADLAVQTMTEKIHASGARVRTATDNSIDWTTQRGWYLSLAASGGRSGERVIQDLRLSNGRIVVSSMNPTLPNGENWTLEINASTGGAPTGVIFDLDGDASFTVGDNVDGNDDNAITNAPPDRAMGIYKGLGLASRTVEARFDDYSDAVVTNLLSGTNPVHTDTPGGDGDPGGDDPAPGDDDYGLAGGHMDLDVSSQTYPIEDGETDQHDHEWDNEYGVVVDFFKIDEQGGFRSVDHTSDTPGSQRTGTFIVNIANAGLSPAGVLEINGVDFPVIEWQAKVKRFLTNSLGPDEIFPVFMLDVPSATQSAKGIFQLISFKMKFASDAITIGGLHPTATGCVKGNDASPAGEYRNGALTTQLLDASGLGYAAGAADPGSLSYDYFARRYGTSSFAIHDTLNYAMPPSGKSHGYYDGLHWESTLFWHWGGGCYSASNIDDYQENFEAETGYADPRTHDGIATGDFEDPYDSEPEEPDPDPPSDNPGSDTGEPVVTQPENTDHSTVTNRVSSGGSSGRLYWREWIPDNL